MKALIQRVQRGSVSVDSQTIGSIARGYVVFLGVKQGDTTKDAKFLAEKTAALRIFPDEADRMNCSITEIDGAVLVISQFTLHADTRKGNRPSFILAASAPEAKSLYDEYVAGLRRIIGVARVATGQFQARMVVEIINDGPVTIELKSHSEP
ncbi:MAG: D-tyrosyl-tRNA(Tyr) deacylase [Verrucomicrobia bacterium]|nr:D-tyrosyl-tRNA(Tyr) deacylase [Verrucomicrobiota bacterium]MBU1736393.1 D-tyrosyl-tRNA(Tyr) deacylase [Verrucomicrobiota bacterium]MBU1855468.1 D-tyrosyl-tRNA(Tyr) deacylase [Verrucomicrobiota bacterium]